MPCRFVQIEIFHITTIGRRVGVVREEIIIPLGYLVYSEEEWGLVNRGVANLTSHIFIKKQLCIFCL